ncbi:MAG: hypothetical protein PHD15_02340 [Clostridia bacterium]|nr:hypothetical protein [Clostridia bacterium]MDD4386586.1 hypothetical protein [Clostridia bacterium]
MYNYDKLSRLQDKYLKSSSNSYKTSMTYVNDETNSLKTTTLLSSIKNGTEAEILYTYDDNGNIDTISKDFNLRQRYYYDGLNQLVRENNMDLNQTISYTYDTGGNLTSKDIYEYTTDISLTGLTKLDTKTYTYDTVWKDKLTNYNGKDITYDNIGNPLTYDGNTYTWQNGRQLASVTKGQNTSGLTEAFDIIKVKAGTLSGDYNGDGKDDVAALYDCGNNQTKIIVWKSTGSGYSNGEVWWDSGVGNFDITKVIGRVVSGDFNADGKDDISVLYDYGNSKSSYLNFISNGTGFDNDTYSEWWKANNNMSIYKYNDSGIRTQKTVNGVTTNYYLEGDKVIYETTGTNTTYYTYDGESNLVGFKYNNTQYYYVRNGQGDITGILDNNLTNVISYTYDTWGKLVSIKDANGIDVTSDTTSIGNINPYRYRGYRYDNETGMYYLQSRYYNPETCRMLNSDSIGGEVGKLLSHNVFTYCLNNPVNMEDDTGHWPTWGQIFSAVAIATITVATVCALVAVAPVIATAAAMTFATVGLASTAATIANVAVVAIATGVGICGANRATQAVTGKNYISEAVFKGNDNAYEKFEATVGVLSISTLSVASAYSYPSTGKSQPSNLKEQLALKQVKSNPSAGKVIVSSLNDARMPGWMGWQKYSQKVGITGGKYDIHYVGNKFIPIFFDFKIK